MEHTIPHTLQDCFAIIDAALSPGDKQAIAGAHDFELQYAFHSGLAGWVRDNVVLKYGLRGEDFFYATDLWHQILLVDDPLTLTNQILVAYRHHLLNN